MKCFTILLTVLIFFRANCKAQELPSVDIVLGFGYPEIVHIGAKVQLFPKHQIGFYYGNGILLTPDEYYYSVTLDHQYHFGKMSKFQNRKVYFFRQDISFVDYKYNYTETNDLVGGLTLGREFNFTGKIGICADIGVKILLYQDRTITNESLVPMFDFSDAVMLPQCRLQLFYSL